MLNFKHLIPFFWSDFRHGHCILRHRDHSLKASNSKEAGIMLREVLSFETEAVILKILGASHEVMEELVTYADEKNIL